MKSYLIALDTSIYTSSESVLVALDQAGVEILKTYNLSFTYLVKATKKQLSSVEGIVSMEDAAKVIKAKAQEVNTDHLRLLVDVNNQKDYNPSYRGLHQTVYLVDTGLNIKHNEFADHHIKFLHTRFDDFQDNNGHGTAVASLIVGNSLGVASQATLSVVKLFDSIDDEITILDVINALGAVLDDHRVSPTNNKVLCLPWVLEQNDFIDAKVLEIDAYGLVVVCAAGNDGVDVNTLSPGGVDTVITVGSHDRDFVVSSFTNTPHNPSNGFVNYGSQLDIFALGVDVNVADHTAIDAYKTISGTSASCAIVAGVALQLINQYHYKTAAEIKELVLDEGHVLGQQYLVFDNADPSVDYSGVFQSIATSENRGEDMLTQTPSGRIATLKLGTTQTIDVGLNTNATDVGVLDFAPLPPWVSFDADTGIVVVAPKNIPEENLPGVFLFAIKGTINEEILIEEFSIRIYIGDESELFNKEVDGYYYDPDFDEYDKVVEYQLATGPK